MMDGGTQFAPLPERSCALKSCWHGARHIRNQGLTGRGLSVRPILCSTIRRRDSQPVSEAVGVRASGKPLASCGASQRYFFNGGIRPGHPLPGFPYSGGRILAHFGLANGPVQNWRFTAAVQWRFTAACKLNMDESRDP